MTMDRAPGAALIEGRPIGVHNDLGLAYLGDPGSHHCENFLRLMKSAGQSVHTLQDSLSSAASSSRPGKSISSFAHGWKQITRLRSQLFGTGDREYIHRLVQEVDANQVRTVVAFWGTHVIADIVALHRRRPHVRIVLNVLCHPTAIVARKVAVQNWFFRRQVSHCDGLILSSRVMKTYIERHVLAGRTMPCLIWPPYLSEHFHNHHRPAALLDRANLLFLGRMDWKRAQATDNVTGLLVDLMNHGVNVHYHRAQESDIDHPNGHAFDYMSLEQAVAYASQFDASLIVYCVNDRTAEDRFRVTVPDRLVASVAAGVPIAIPSVGYDACREYLKNYRGVVEFSSPADLASQLNDRATVDRLRRFASEDSRAFAGEAHAATLASFLAGLLSTQIHG